MKSGSFFVNVALIVGSFIEIVVSRSANIRIVGGKEVDISERPYIAALFANGEMTCGSSLIAKDILVTAAHCVIDLEPENASIRAGSSFYSSGGQLRNVSKIVSHENFTDFDVNYDIALIWLTAPVTVTNAQVIELAPANKSVNETSLATVSGWGLTAEMGKDSPHLRSVDIPVTSKEACGYGETRWCAGLPAGGKDSCQGDSGGPAVIEGQLTGIVSSGDGCAEPNKPGAYISIPVFRKWIKEHAGI